MNLGIVGRYLSPRVDNESQAIIDRETVSNVFVVSAAVVVIQVVSLTFFISTRGQIGPGEMSSIRKVLASIVFGMVSHICAAALRQKDPIPHKPAAFLTCMLYLLFSGWAIWVSQGHYAIGEQLTSFFAVELVLVCFVPLRPSLGAFMTSATYASLYAVFWQVDGAARVNSFNFIILAIVSALGMAVRYHSQVQLADAIVKQHRANEKLEQLNRLDGLTGLSNRVALKEDASLLVGEHVVVRMVDINYFKEINDTYGHLVGDEILIQAGAELRTLFPEGRCYRFGGDEFLVLCTGVDAFEGDTFKFHSESIDGEILLSIGRAEGDLRASDDLFDLIGVADASLYKAKSRTHSPEYGGHDRRSNQSSR